jgi:hypothetical protein
VRALSNGADRNNRGIAHENGSIESAHGHLKRVIGDALLLRSARDFDDLKDYRAFVDEILSRKNARNAHRIEIERAQLQSLPDTRTCDYEDTLVYVTSSGGFTLRKVFYTVPSRLIGCRLRVRLYDDRLEVFVGRTLLMELVRGHAGPNGRHGHVVNYHHIIHALRRKPMALVNLIYRDQLFPREVYRATFERLREQLSERAACRLMVELLSLAHERSCEARMGVLLSECLAANQLPDLASLQARFAPNPARFPVVLVKLAPLADYETLTQSPVGEAA